MSTSLRSVWFSLTVVFAFGCAARQLPAGRGDARVDLAAPFARAVETEETKGAEAAMAAYLDLVDLAVNNAAAPLSSEALLASVDALTLRSAPGLERIGEHHALAFRVHGAFPMVKKRFESAYERAAYAGPFARSVLADGMLELAMFEGDANAAKTARERAGCVRAATVVGPIDWAPITAVSRPTPLEGATDALLGSYRGIGPFVEKAVPTIVTADDCALGLLTSSVLEGMRAVAFDVDVPKAQTIGVVLESPSTAALVVGGKPATMRGYELGGGPVAKWATADVGAGRVRIVARVGSNGEGTRIALRVFGEDGLALPSHAPRPGEAANVVPTRVAEVAFGSDRKTDAERALVAAAMLAQGDARSAEHLVETFARGKDATPLTALMYARSIDQAGDLPENRAVERERDALETTLRSWPNAWEGILGHAQLTARRRGASEGRLEALRELAEAEADHPSLDPMVSVFEAATAAEGKLFDVSERAFSRLAGPLSETPMLAELDDVIHDRVGAELEQHACRTAHIDRSSLDCLSAKVGRGDRRGALAEIARLRALRDSPAALRQLELTQRIALGDAAGAKQVYDAMLPAERTVSALGILLPESPGAMKSQLKADLLAASDVPGSLPAFATILRETSAAEFETEGLALVAADRKNRSLSNAATAVLKHLERYAIDEGGLLHYTLYDLRRVSGTTDVEQGAQGGAALIDGRDVRRTLRRRIHKPDGRVLEPDRASNASQQHADLSQLEKGDYVEQIVEGWALPGASGQLVVDSPDLLPERTSVSDASIEVRRPASLSLSMWSHALLGKPTERVDGKQKVTTFTMKDRPPRRLEEGVPKMDRDVAVSFGTSTWNEIGRSVAEGIASLADRDPFVSAWARAAARGEDVTNPKPSVEPIPSDERTVVSRIAAAAGKSVKVASGAVLSDSAGSLPAGAQNTTARTILELGEGSRSWLAYRALVECGMPADIVVAEREPFSADPHFPPHYGRFDYPLVIAHTKQGDIWLDLDVQGPPLPAGRVSPELRGRMAMNAKAQMIPVGGTPSEEAGDEVDIRLKLDDAGNAKGTFTILLRGRTAQSLADALEKVVGTDRDELLRGVVLGWVPWANVEEVALSSSEGSWQVSVRATVTIPSYAQAEGSSFILPGFEPLHAGFPRPFVGTLGATFAGSGARENALAIDDAFQYHVHRRVEWKPSMKLVSRLPTVEVKDNNLEAFRRGKLEAGVVEEEFGLSIATGTLDPNIYEKFAEKAHRVDDGFQAAARVTLGSARETNNSAH